MPARRPETGGQNLRLQQSPTQPLETPQPIRLTRGGPTSLRAAADPIRAASQGASELWHVGPHYPKFPVYPQGWAVLGVYAVV